MSGSGPSATRRALLTVALALGLARAVPAAERVWEIVPQESFVTFQGTQFNQIFDGVFSRFSADLAFDPARPEGGRLALEIETGSAQTLDPQRDAMLRQPAWFDVARHPTARFEADRITRTGDRFFRADGRLQIRGIERPAEVRFRLDLEGPAGTPTGARILAEMELDRTSFGLGVGEWWSAPWVVGERVLIHVALRAVPR